MDIEKIKSVYEKMFKVKSFDEDFVEEIMECFGMTLNDFHKLEYLCFPDCKENYNREDYLQVEIRILTVLILKSMIEKNKNS